MGRKEIESEPLELTYVVDEFCSPHQPIDQEFFQWGPTIQQIIESGIPEVDDPDANLTITCEYLISGESFIRTVYGDHIPDNISVHQLRRCYILVARDEREPGGDWCFFAYDPNEHPLIQDIPKCHLTPAQAEEIFTGLGTSEIPLNVKIERVRKGGCSLLLQLIGQLSKAA